MRLLKIRFATETENSPFLRAVPWCARSALALKQFDQETERHLIAKVWDFAKFPSGVETEPCLYTSFHTTGVEDSLHSRNVNHAVSVYVQAR